MKLRDIFEHYGYLDEDKEEMLARAYINPQAPTPMAELRTLMRTHVEDFVADLDAEADDGYFDLSFGRSIVTDVGGLAVIQESNRAFAVFENERIRELS